VPAFPTGCGGPSGLDYVSKENVTSDINRFLFKDGTIIYVRGDNPSCRIGLNLLSNISRKDIPEYDNSGTYKESDKVLFFINIDANNYQNPGSGVGNLTSEIDQIISQSSFK
jgi:hypothetical protein